MSAEHFPQIATSDSDSTIPSEKSLGEVLAYVGALKPQCFHLPASVKELKTFGNEAIAGLSDGKVVLVTVNPAVAYLLESEKPSTGEVHSVDVSRDQQLAMSGHYAGEVKVWSVPEKRELASFSTDLESVMAVVITPDCNIGIAGGKGKSMKVWNLKNMSEIVTLEGCSDIYCITVTRC
jgi:WD40 repeat protein